MNRSCAACAGAEAVERVQAFEVAKNDAFMEKKAYVVHIDDVDVRKHLEP